MEGRGHSGERKMLKVGKELIMKPYLCQYCKSQTLEYIVQMPVIEANCGGSQGGNRNIGGGKWTLMK